MKKSTVQYSFAPLVLVLALVVLFCFTVGATVYVEPQLMFKSQTPAITSQEVNTVKQAIASDTPALNISDEVWKQILTPEQYNVIVKHQTEAPYANENMLDEKREGLYVTAGCEQPVFVSSTKYDSSTGWPSFWQAIEGSTRTEKDTSYGMSRNAVYATRCHEYLGHVFDDGPEPTGLRYCMNSPALKFIPKEELNEKQLEIFELNSQLVSLKP